jgi:hypothetical protein
VTSPSARDLALGAQSATEKAIYFYGYTFITRAWKALYGNPG